MRHCIARAILASLCTLLSLAFPARGHRRRCLTAQAQAPASAPTPEPVIPPSPWSRPWTSISKEEAAEIFRLQIENDQLALSAWELRIQWERRRAAALATMGIDHPYTYPDAPFDAESFRTRT